MTNEVCELCGREAELVELVCRSCNPESHEYEDLTELDHFIRNGGGFDLSDYAIELWEEIKTQYEERVSVE